MTAHDRATAFLSIDLDAVAANWRLIRDMVAPAEAAGVVKADSYGLGMLPVARRLWREGCRTFFVATIDEGMALRAALPKARILALCGAMPGTAADLAGNGLVPVLNSLDQIGQWVGFARARGEELPAALHLDTGMNRLGLMEPAVAALADDKSLLAGARVDLVMSHMACADEPDHGKNPEQLAAFRHLSARLGLKAPLSLGASSTIFLGRDHHFDLVRPGAALYGLNPVPDRPNPMAGVVRLQAKILQVRDVDSPMTVGYGASHQFAGKARVATVAVGYADGLFRSLGNRGFGFIEGVRVPVVGRISMDLTTFDVSALPPEQARPGALVELLGPHQSADALAAQAGTIGYEILTALGARHRRDYVGEAA